MKIKHLILAAALVVGFSSCSKDEGGNNETGEKDLYLQFTQPANTRADVTQIAEGSRPEFNSGHLFFATASGEVKRYIRINNSGIVGTLTPAALQKGTIIKSLSSDITMVHLYANIKPEETLQISNISEMDDVVIKHEDERDADGMVSNLTLMGSGVIQAETGTTADGETYKYAARFTIAPLVARIEIKALSADPDEGPSAYDLNAIFINNYYPDYTLGNAPKSPVVNWLQHIPAYQSKDKSSAGEYKTADRIYLYDDGYDGTDFGLGSPAVVGIGGTNYLSISPDNDVWAYNVFASGEPHIVFHLSNVFYNDGTPYDNEDVNAFDPQDAYLTVTRFVRHDNGAQVTLAGGNVYRLVNLVFTDKDLGDTPEPPENGKRDVYVVVEVMKWEITEVDGKFD